jgi:hypothetical protein
MARIHIVRTLQFHDDDSFSTVVDIHREFDLVPMRADRSAVGTAKNLGKQAGDVGSTAGVQANQIGSTLIPSLTADVTHPTGLSAGQKSNYLTGAAETAGGVNAGLTGEANLATARTRNAGGLAPALDEAARIKQRQLATGTQQVNNIDTQLANQKRAQALQQLQGLYGTDTSNQLRAMGLQGQDLSDQLAAGRQGWLQNTEGVIDTLSGAAKGAGALGVRV